MGAETHNKADTAWLKDQHVELAASAGKVGIFEWNLVTGEIFWLPQNHLIFGVDPGSEITYGTFLNRVRPSDVEPLEREMAAVRTSRIEFEHAYPMSMPDGRTGERAP